MGLVLKMYANESKGMKFPRLHVWDTVANPGFGTDIAAAPYIPSIYPEYLTDPSILVCPSDAGDTVQDLKFSDGRFCIAVNSQDHTQGPSGEGGCSDLADASYAYVGWLIDRASDDPLFTDPDGGSLQLTAIAPAVLDAPGTNGVKSLDEDIDVSSSAPGLGNGGGNTVYRLREGIERFLITDINNPAGSAKAQSEIYIMFDVLATDVTLYNHVPGGCNVLYMDGHVAFIRYPSEQPVSKAMAISVGLIMNL